MPAPSSSPRPLLRQQMRQRRRALSPQQQQLAARKLTHVIGNSAQFKRSRDIAFYLCNDGEIDPHQLLLKAHRRHKRCYLPVLSPSGALWFSRYRPGDSLTPNRFGILEPSHSQQQRKGWSLSLVLMPLVAFDRKGGRLGMGGGFYDRSFAWIRHCPQLRRPKLLGLAHQFQEVEALAVESWDIPLWGIATDGELIVAMGKHSI